MDVDICDTSEKLEIKVLFLPGLQPDSNQLKKTKLFDDIFTLHHAKNAHTQRRVHVGGQLKAAKLSLDPPSTPHGLPHALVTKAAPRSFVFSRILATNMLVPDQILVLDGNLTLSSLV